VRIGALASFSAQQKHPMFPQSSSSAEFVGFLKQGRPVETTDTPTVSTESPPWTEAKADSGEIGRLQLESRALRAAGEAQASASRSAAAAARSAAWCSASSLISVTALLVFAWLYFNSL